MSNVAFIYLISAYINIDIHSVIYKIRSLKLIDFHETGLNQFLNENKWKQWITFSIFFFFLVGPNHSK